MTLFETILYIALMGMLMTTLILSSFTFIQQNQSLERAAFKAEANILNNFNDYKE